MSPLTSVSACLARLILAVAALLIATAPAGAQPSAAKKYALLVGVNEYTNRKFDNLKYAERDILELAKELRTAGYEVRSCCPAPWARTRRPGPTSRRRWTRC